jgi:hypothetical protein
MLVYELSSVTIRFWVQYGLILAERLPNRLRFDMSAGSNYYLVDLIINLCSNNELENRDVLSINKYISCSVG